jgi:hypothetical protein
MGKNKRPFPARIAEKLLAIRLSLNLSQTEMLKEIHPDKDPSLRGSIISEFERACRSPSLLEALAYARLAKISVEQLIDDELDLPKEIMESLDVAHRREKKVVRDTFTMLVTDCELLNTLRERLLQKGIYFSKSEIIRAGLATLNLLENSQLSTAMNMIEKIKIGRRRKENVVRL